jgi:hypothetical protein
VLRDSPVMREISRSDFFFRLCKRRILPIMSMVITPHPLLHKIQQGRLFTWLSFGSAQPSKVAQFSVGANWLWHSGASGEPSAMPNSNQLGK